jgi:hypothetical protein
MTKFRSKRKQLAPRQPRYEKCVWCEQNVNLNANDWVCDGNKEVLHTDCFAERMGIIKDENRKKRANS